MPGPIGKYRGGPCPDAADMGVKNIAVMQPDFMRVNVTGAFEFGAANANETKNPTKTFEVTEDGDT